MGAQAAIALPRAVVADASRCMPRIIATAKERSGGVDHPPDPRCLARWRCWARVVPQLAAAGARVLAPTLSGLGRRPSLSPPSLETHVDEVVELVVAQPGEVVLVGHSHSGMVITAAADRVKSRLKHLVYLDAAVPGDGDDFASSFPGISVEDAERRRRAFRSLSTGGEWIAPVAPDLVGVIDQGDADWLRRKLTPHPLRTWLEPVSLPHGGHAGIPKTYVLATRPPATVMGYPLHGEAARRDPEWTYREIACGHDMMVIDPTATARLLLEAAESRTS